MLNFNSQHLQRQVDIGEVHDLELEDCRELHVELTMAIQGIVDGIKEVHCLEREAGVPYDKDWMHRARKKRRITLAFATEAKRRLLKLEGVDGIELRKKQSYYEMQREKFLRFRQGRIDALLREELLPGVLEEIYSEAHEAAEADFKAWLDEHDYEQYYIL